MMDHLLITRGAAIGLAVAFVALLTGMGYLVKIQYDLNNERDVRLQQVNRSFLLNCHQREAEVGELRRFLHLPPTGFNCDRVVISPQERSIP